MRGTQGNGFTLIELMIVVVVIGILATLAIPKYGSSKQRAARTAGISDIRNLTTQEERFYSENGRYGDLNDTAALKFTLSPGNSSLALTIAGAPPGSGGFNASFAIAGSQTCGVFVGAAARPTGMPSSVQEGTPACW
jgi:prepilin-type N-terminal cleavage/methylation domain-containing protein